MSRKKPPRRQSRASNVSAANHDLPSKHRQELLGMKRHAAEKDDAARVNPPADGAGDGAADGPDDFLRMMAARKKKRKEQLMIVKELVEDPLRFGLKTDKIPSSTSPEEIERRRKELEYRLAMLRTLLEITESEMELLSQAGHEGETQE